jgi:hypothetical protein
MRSSTTFRGARRGASRPIRIVVGIALVLAALTAPAHAQDTITFRWRDPVRCGPDGTLRFDAGSRLDLIDRRAGLFEFRGEAREESRRREAYAITLTFIDWRDRVLFRIASEPFEMEPNRRTDFLVFGREGRIADFWNEIAAVELDAHVPLEPLFEDAWDHYRGVLRYRRVQNLEGRIFR